jgi:TPR repeat protein
MNRALARQYYKLAADQGNADAQLLYDHLCREGAHILIDLLLVMQPEWSPKCHIGHSFCDELNSQPRAADSGDVISQLDIAVRLAIGEGIPIDKQRAIKYRKVVSNSGLGIAQFRYALLLDELTEVI